MKITWNIEKKRGNFRPVLRYSIILEEYEKELAVNSVNIHSTLPKLECPHSAHCLPGEYERQPDWQPHCFHWIAGPYFRDGIAEGSLRLPFRECGEYPEVEETFKTLRDSHEMIVKEAYDCPPIQQNGELDVTDETRQAIATTLTARKMLSFCAA